MGGVDGVTPRGGSADLPHTPAGTPAVPAQGISPTPRAPLRAPGGEPPTAASRGQQRTAVFAAIRSNKAEAANDEALLSPRLQAVGFSDPDEVIGWLHEGGFGSDQILDVLDKCPRDAKAVLEELHSFYEDDEHLSAEKRYSTQQLVTLATTYGAGVIDAIRLHPKSRAEELFTELLEWAKESAPLPVEYRPAKLVGIGAVLGVDALQTLRELRKPLESLGHERFQLATIAATRGSEGLQALADFYSKIREHDFAASELGEIAMVDPSYLNQIATRWHTEDLSAEKIRAELVRRTGTLCPVVIGSEVGV